MIVFLRALRNIGDVLGSAQVFFIIVNSDFFTHKDFFILIMFLRKQSWRNSFAMKRCGKCVYFSITKFTELG